MALFDAQIRRLSSLFGAVRDTFTDLIRRAFAGTVDAGQAQEAAGDVIQDLLDASTEWVEENMPEFYARGIRDAAKDMGVDATNIVDTHDAVIDSLMEDVLDDLEGTIDEAERQLRSKLREAARARTLSSLGTDDAKSPEEPFFVDRAGREWDFETRAEQKLRDWVTDTVNSGTAATALQFDSPGIKIEDARIDPDNADEPCKIADGQVWSVPYFLANTKEHPQCTRRGRPLPPDTDPESIRLDRS